MLSTEQSSYPANNSITYIIFLYIHESCYDGVSIICQWTLWYIKGHTR